MAAPKDPFKSGKAKAGKRVVKAEAARLAKTSGASRAIAEGVQMALPIPGPKKAKAAVKGAKAAVRTGVKAVTAVTKKKKPASPERVKEVASGARKMLAEKDPARRIAMAKRLGKGKKI
jgi:hypothetical protein